MTIHWCGTGLSAIPGLRRLSALARRCHLPRLRPLAAWTTTLAMLVIGSIYWENLPWFRHKFVAPLWILVLLSAAEHRPKAPPRWLREGAVLVLAAFYGGAGLAKLGRSGLAWADGTGLQLWLLRLGDRGSPIREWVVADATLASLLAGGVLLLELAVLIAPFAPRARRPLGVLLLALHLGIDLCLHIDFRPQMLLVALVLLPRPDGRAASGRGGQAHRRARAQRSRADRAGEQ